MPVQLMTCPRCGKEATEYDKNQWQCLNPRCGAKFNYHPPNRKEIIVTRKIDGATFTCRGCGGVFPMLQYPQYRCTTCGGTFCWECKSKGHPIMGLLRRDGFQCRHCINRDLVAPILFALGLLLLLALRGLSVFHN